jgi:hypothetical protein
MNRDRDPKHVVPSGPQSLSLANSPAGIRGDGEPRRRADPVDIDFLLGVNPALLPVMRGVASVYGKFFAATRGVRAMAWLTRDHFLFFVLAALCLPMLMPRTIALMVYAFDRFVLGAAIVRPPLAGWPSMPAIVLPCVGASLLAFFLPRAHRLTALVVLSFAGGLAFGYLDFASLLVFGAFVAITFGVIRLPISRLAAALVLCLLALGLLQMSVHWFEGMAIASVGTFPMALVPMLWYSAYEHKLPRRPLALPRLSGYLFVRFFDGPVVTHGDMFSPVSGKQLVATRFAGMKALYVAAAASLAAALGDMLWSRYQVAELRGLPLLLLSYAGYVGTYCKLVVLFNVIIGILRLFGIPVRDNFNYWLLARTPNEHWQRWNLLFREWVITFVFFPIMKSRRWLFAAIMCSLLVSGLLHVIPAALTRSLGLFGAVLDMGYWIVNGFAIYIVIKIPLLLPRMVPALRMKGSLAWSVVGVVATSSFYAVLHGARVASSDWEDVADYFERLVQILP